ncbi:FtsK/SpoIIIE domain-containing protein [Cellulomonas iranensis]|uniref:FtsK/SpoIIIE domain-containing protein n=1 Tax=Cellulomonas iranensis TaxID=76862 RepID=UPI0013D897C1|nr:FtsK/SpoIIIE domain-containing protein [Cellulomonas iranensis]
MMRVPLPHGYDDRRDRPALIARLHEVDAALQVNHLAPDRDGGLCAWVTTGELEPEPLAEVWALGPGTSRAQGPALAEVARVQGKVLTRFDAAAGVATVARIAPAVVRLRDAIAPHVGCGDRPWDVAITARWGTDGEGQTPHVTQIHVHRAGQPVLDRAKRMSLWRQIAATVVPSVQGAAWLVEDRPADGEIVLTRRPDPLGSGFTLPEFAARYRAEDSASWQSYPVAITEGGEAVRYSLFHTLVVGQTGAGKGSVLWSIMSGLIPAARQGLVEFLAVDPKSAEAKDPLTGAPSALFSRVATTPEEWSIMLDDVVADLKERQSRSGRSFEPSVETPLRIVFIDEMSALSALDVDPKRAKQVQQNLLTTLSQGRSDGVIVIAAVQAPQKEMVGQTRMFFALRIALRTETPTETDLVLGDGATEQGAAAHLIPPANPGNGYATAGVGYMRLEGEALPVRVRFPYTSDADLHRWSEEFAQRAAPMIDLEWDMTAFETTSKEEDE